MGIISISDTVYGSSHDWVSHVAMVKYSYIFEMDEGPGEGINRFVARQRQVEPNAEEMLAAVRTIAKAIMKEDGLANTEDWNSREREKEISTKQNISTACKRYVCILLLMAKSIHYY